MKKRILSMLLVVCMLVISLASCAYSYDNDDMTKYANFDLGAFKAALQTLEITDATFGTDEAKRQEQVKDAIIKALAGIVDEDKTKIKEGKLGANDKVFYCYYVTADFDGETVVFYAAKMKEASVANSSSDALNTSLQLGLSTLKDLDKKVADALLGIEKFEDVNYVTTTGGTVTVDKDTKAAPVVAISYTVTYTDAEGAEVKDMKKNYSNKIVVLPTEKTGEKDKDGNATAANFLEYLLGQSIGGTITAADFKETIDGKEYNAAYTGIKIDWQITEGWDEDGITVKDVTYEKPENPGKDYKGTKVKDITGTERDLDDKELTYHIYPVYYTDVIEYTDVTATLVLEELLSNMKAGGDADEDGELEDSEKGTLNIFTDDGYTMKDKDGKTVKINALIAELITLLAEEDSAEKAVEDAEDKLEKAKKALEEAEKKGTVTTQKDDFEAAEKALKDAKEKLEGVKASEGVEAKKGAAEKVDDKIAEIFSCTKENGEKVEDVIIADYKQYQYDTLEKSYEAAIKKSLSTAIYEAAVKAITYKTDEHGKFVLPEAAVKEAYDRYINNYKYDYYKGTYSSTSSGSSSSKTNYEQFASFEDYLRDELTLKDATNDKLYAAIREDAEQIVKDKVLVYMLKEVCDEDVSVTKEDIDEFKSSVGYLLLEYQLGKGNIKESDYMPGLQLNNIFDYFLDEAPEKENDNKIYYKNISYTAKPAEAK